ncbi:MAG: hypothetical protein M1269_10615 [Chloroflexi bacterium]|nr:hypothetical protein [Chloroflexota bacterium]
MPESMPLCPFREKPCTTECALFAAGIEKCAFVALTTLTEEIHDMGVYAYDKFVRELPPPGLEEDDQIEENLPI